MNSSAELKGIVGKDGKYKMVNSYTELEKIDSWVMKQVCKPGKVRKIEEITPPQPKNEREYTYT